MNIHKLMRRITKPVTILSGILVLVGYLTDKLLLWPFVAAPCYILAGLLAGTPILYRAIQGLRARTIGIEVLVSVAVVGAFFIDEYSEAAIVTFLFLFGGFLEQKTLERTRSSIKALIQLAPVTALLLREDGSTDTVGIDEVMVQDRLLVKTGAQVPVDGTILEGSGYLNEASMSGEAKPVHKQAGDTVYAGSLLENGTLRIRADRVGEDTTFAKIIALVEEAQDAKSPLERFIDRFAVSYTPAVLILAVAVGLLFRDLSFAITALVLGCPGALVIGPPVSNVAGIGNGAQHGVLIKGGEVMSTLAKVDTFVFDKTGTLTTGKPAVSAAIVYSGDPARVWALAARAESISDHPLGSAIIRHAHQQGVLDETLPLVGGTTERGQGIRAEVDGADVLLGNRSWMERNGIRLTRQQQQDLADLQATGASTVLMGVAGTLALLIGIADTIRPDVKAELLALRRAGAAHMMMLTGDHAGTAQQVAQTLGLDEVAAELLPQDKLEHVRRLQAQGRVVAFVGDGINDSPSLAAADIGIAMGGGTDVAVETSDVVLMRSRFAELVHAYGIAQSTVRNTYQNIAIALGTVFFLIAGLLLGYIHMASGMFIHELSILVVILNAMRLLRYRPARTRSEQEQDRSAAAHPAD